MKILALSLVASLSLAGCEARGITRTATVDDVDIECVYLAIASVPGVDKVRYVGVNHLYYSNSVAHAGLIFAPDRHDLRQYNFSASSLDEMTAAEVIATRTLMMQVEHQVEDLCGLAGLTTSVAERCAWKTCE